MGNIIDHAKRELELIGYDLNDKEEGPNKWMVENLLELLNVFSNQGHSGFSAPYCVRLFSKLALLESITPLNGGDDEWIKIGDNLYQNKRNSYVFKENGKAYNIEGKIFREPDGGCYTNMDSRVYIDFPYIPKSEYIDVDFAKDGD